MKNKKMLIILVVILVIGFASVSGTLILNGKVNIGVNKEDFNIIFVETILDSKENNSLISEDKKSITFESKKLTNIGEKTKLEYKVKNISTQYDGKVKINCINMNTDNLKVIGEFAGNTMPISSAVAINAGEVKSGSIEAELIKSTIEDTNVKITCTIEVTGSSRDSITDEKYSITFNTNGGNTVEEKIVKYYEKYGELPTPTKEGYTFIGWYIGEDENAEIIKEDTINKIKENQTLNAKWKYICPYEVGKTWNYDYIGSEQEFVIPCDGEYKLETWGASGGSFNETYRGGYGGYTTGEIKLTKEEKIYISVGGEGSGNGTHQNQKGGYNGGGDATIDSDGNTRQSSGGGATHIATVSGNLGTLEEYKGKYNQEKRVNESKEILIVSGGGGGTGSNYVLNIKDNVYTLYSIGDAGGYVGKTGEFHSIGNKYSLPLVARAYGGTQDRGGIAECEVIENHPAIYHGNGSFGSGASSVYSGGGGGFFGGSASHDISGGGSGYIGNPLLTNKAMYCYNCEESTEEAIKTISTTNVSATPISNYAKKGNGYARITLVKTD